MANQIVFLTLNPKMTSKIKSDQLPGRYMAFWWRTASGAISIENHAIFMLQGVSSDL
jgi:hypothetical protein